MGGGLSGIWTGEPGCGSMYTMAAAVEGEIAEVGREAEAGLGWEGGWFWVCSFGGCGKRGGGDLVFRCVGSRVVAIGGGVAPVGLRSERLERVGEEGVGPMSGLGSGWRWAGWMPSSAGGAVLARVSMEREDVSAGVWVGVGDRLSLSAAESLRMAAFILLPS